MVSAPHPGPKLIHFASSLLATLGITTAGAALADLKPTAPPKVDLTALWKINVEQSDDPQKVVASKKQSHGPAGGGGGSTRKSGGVFGGIDAGDILGGIMGGTVGGTVSTGTHRGGGGGADPNRPAGDPAPATQHFPLDWFLATREQMDLQQVAGALTISTDDETSTCKPPDTTPVRVANGDTLNQRCGWDGATFVVELTSPDGVARVNRYELRKNDRQLVMTSEIKGGHTELAGVKIRRVYDRSF